MSWQDSHTDAKPTVVTFTGCKISGTASGFRSATLNLYDEMGLLPDQSVGKRTNTCGAVSWGERTRSDRYHWTVEAMNGGVDSAMRLSVSTVTTSF